MKNPSNDNRATPGRRSSEPTGVVFDIKRYAIHDGPGIRTTVFMKGCPLRCRWCHNPESFLSDPQLSIWTDRCLSCGSCSEACEKVEVGEVVDPVECAACGRCVDACPTAARQLVGETVGVRELIRRIERDVLFYDQSGGGVTFSGGEPLMQPEFLAAMLQECHSRDIHTTVDTSLYADWSQIDGLKENVNLFLVDLKSMDPEIHKQYTGGDVDRILENISRLGASGARVRVRIPLIADVNDDIKNIEATGRFLTLIGTIEQVDLLPYHSSAEAKSRRIGQNSAETDFSAPTESGIELIQKKLSEIGLKTTIGG